MSAKYVNQVQEEFVQKVIESLEQGVLPWRKPFGNNAENLGLPYNEITNNAYQGVNQIVLMMASRQHGFKDPRWMTFKQASNAGCRVKKGAVSSPLFFFSRYDKQQKKNITDDEFKRMNVDERAHVIINTQIYRVFNAEQITGLEPFQRKHIEFSNELCAEAQENMLKNMNLEMKSTADTHAYYDLDADNIHLPNPDIFDDEEAYYATAFHEIAHATGHKSRLDRNMVSISNKSYAVEELRAEFASAFMAQELAINTEAIEAKSIAYLQSWAAAIKNDKKVLFGAIRDATKMYSYMKEKGFVDELKEAYYVDKPFEKTLYVNLFGGPGSGKTTAAHEIIANLKKSGIEAEYVPEVARDYIYDNKQHLLDGSFENEIGILNEKYNRLERLNQKVQVVVTDSPLHASGIYFGDHDHSEQETKEFQDYLRGRLKKLDADDLNYFIKRGPSFEQKDRVHNEEQSIALDEKNLSYLKENAVEFESFNHQGISSIVQEVERKVKLLKQLDSTESKTAELLKSISIVDFAREELGYSFRKEAGGRFRSEEHDSLVVFPNNTWHRFSTGQGGNLVELLKVQEDMPVSDAIKRIKEYAKEYSPTTAFDDSPSNNRKDSNLTDLECPEKAKSNENVYKYLEKKRALDRSVIADYVKRGLLYEDTSKNCVFLGKYDNRVLFGSTRSTTGKSKKDLAGSFKAVGVHIDNGSHTLILNESVIDQMSYQSFMGPEKRDKYDYLSVNGVGGATQTLNFHMIKRESSANIKNVVIAFDNDTAGKEATEKILLYLKERFPQISVVVHSPVEKDFNEDLIKAKSRDINFSKAASSENEKIDALVAYAEENIQSFKHLFQRPLLTENETEEFAEKMFENVNEILGTNYEDIKDNDEVWNLLNAASKELYSKYSENRHEVTEEMLGMVL